MFKQSVKPKGKKRAGKAKRIVKKIKKMNDPETLHKAQSSSKGGMSELETRLGGMSF